jgi:DNA-binding CsgD family transcriptional regulator
LNNSRYFHEWARPQGFIDAIQLIVMRQNRRVGALGLSRHESVGNVTERDLAVLRMLAPHIRRAVAISDILDQQVVTIGTFEASLNVIQIGVVLVDRDAQIIHANRTAEVMLKAGSPIRSEHGEIRVHQPEISAALRSAIATAANDEAAMGRVGIGVPAPHSDGDPALIHVLPLTGGQVRSRIAPRATAALFITTKLDDFGTPLEALAILFGLTAAEMRLLGSLLNGNSLADAAETLGIAITTARTHLAHIFDKTGTSRQADLIRLAAKFAPPIGRPS